jgi:protoporphyrinogen oxidase
MKVGIIGGGVAGLAAAYRLTQRGHQVALYEAEPTLGGLVRTFEVGGGRLESFYHHLFTTDTTIIDLIDELGLGDRLVWRDSKVGFYHGGRIYDFVTPLDLLRFSPVSLLDRVRLGLAGLWLRRQKNWHRYESITAKEWIIRHVGQRNYEVVWGPLLRGKFGTAHDQVGMVWFWGKIFLRFASRRGGPSQREQLGYLMGSFGAMLDELERRIRATGAVVETDRPVERVLVEDGRAVGLRLAGGEQVDCDAVIAAVSSDVLLKLVPPLPAEYERRLSSVQWQSTLCLILALRNSLSRIYWMNISDPEIPFIAAIEHTNFIEREHYSGHHVLYLSNYLEPTSPLLQMDINELCDLYLPHLRKLNPGFSPDWIEDRWLFQGPAAQPIITTHYSQKIPDHRTPIPGLYLANMAQIYPEDRGQNYSIRMGEQIAEMAVEDFGASAIQ